MISYQIWTQVVKQLKVNKCRCKINNQRYRHSGLSRRNQIKHRDWGVLKAKLHREYKTEWWTAANKRNPKTSLLSNNNSNNRPNHQATDNAQDLPVANQIKKWMKIKTLKTCNHISKDENNTWVRKRKWWKLRMRKMRKSSKWWLSVIQTWKVILLQWARNKRQILQIIWPQKEHKTLVNPLKGISTPTTKKNLNLKSHYQAVLSSNRSLKYHFICKKKIKLRNSSLNNQIQLHKWLRWKTLLIARLLLRD